MRVEWVYLRSCRCKSGNITSSRSRGLWARFAALTSARGLHTAAGRRRLRAGRGTAVWRRHPAVLQAAQTVAACFPEKRLVTMPVQNREYIRIFNYADREYAMSDPHHPDQRAEQAWRRGLGVGRHAARPPRSRQRGVLPQATQGVAA